LSGEQAAASRELLDQLVDDSDGRESTLWRWARVRTTASPARALGFDVATAGGSTGDALSPRTVGHVGFTGTSLWFDLDADRAYVLLSNAVHGGRDGVRERNRALRRPPRWPPQRSNCARWPTCTRPTR
jgi:CubicO group peptidase (beta-lactamase class C family)